MPSSGVSTTSVSIPRIVRVAGTTMISFKLGSGLHRDAPNSSQPSASQASAS
jgi:hypothetical protein